MSEGNGHPYSWSAIFNGYDPDRMSDIEFPVIPQYLGRQMWPDARIKGAVVTHVWTQDRHLSERIAGASLIENVVDAAEQMIPFVDGVLLARDDAENHLRFARPFMEAGLPVYVDKPAALSMNALAELYSLERYPGQLFTCSALRYSQELMLSEEDRSALGSLREIHAMTPKSWDKYAIHVIEPVLSMLRGELHVQQLHRHAARAEGGAITAVCQDGVIVRIFAVGDDASAPLTIRVIGQRGWRELEFKDSFSAFKAALQDFVDGIVERSVKSPRRFNESVVELIAAGRS